MEVEGRNSDVESLVDNDSPRQRSGQESDDEQIYKRSPSPDGVLSAADSESEVDIFPGGEDEDISNNDDSEEDIGDDNDKEEVYQEDVKSIQRKESEEEAQGDGHADVDSEAEIDDEEGKDDEDKKDDGDKIDDEDKMGDEDKDGTGRCRDDKEERGYEEEVEDEVDEERHDVNMTDDRVDAQQDEEKELKRNKDKDKNSVPISEDEADGVDEHKLLREDTAENDDDDDDDNERNKPKAYQSEQNKPSAPDNAKRGKKKGDTNSRPVKKKEPKKKASFKSSEASGSRHDLNDSGNGDDQREKNKGEKPQLKGKKQNKDKSRSRVQVSGDPGGGSKEGDPRDAQQDQADQKKMNNQRQNSQRNQRNRKPATDKSTSKSRENLRASDGGNKGKEEDDDDYIDSVSVDRSRPQSQVSPKRRSKSSSRKKTTPRKNPSRSNSSDEIFERLHRSDTISFSGSAIKDAPRAEDVISRKPYGTESELKEISERLFTTPIMHSKTYIRPRARDIISRQDLEPEELDRVFDRLHNTGTISLSGHAPLNGPVAIDEISRDVTSGREVRQIAKRLNSSHTLSSASSDRCRTTPELPPIGYGQKQYPIIKGIETRFQGRKQLEYPKVVAAVDRLYSGHTHASKSRVDAPVSEKPAFVLREYMGEIQTWK